MRPPQKVLLLGSTGQIGWELMRTLAPLGEIIAPTRREVDLTRPDELGAAVRAVRPTMIVNAAAYTAVEQAEEDVHTAEMVNAVAPGVLAEEAARCGALMVHLSTDYIFDGTKRIPYVETDVANPLNVYGKTKYAGEEAVRDAGDEHLIFRTSWVYGARGENFFTTMLRLFAEREEVRVVYDQVGAPTWSRTIAEAVAQVVSMPLRDSNGRRGTFHLSAAGETTWHGFASAILGKIRMDALTTRILPISTQEFPSKVVRPAYSVLSNGSLHDIGLRLPQWDDSLEALVAELDEVA